MKPFVWQPCRSSSIFVLVLSLVAMVMLGGSLGNQINAAQSSEYNVYLPLVQASGTQTLPTPTSTVPPEPPVTPTITPEPPEPPVTPTATPGISQTVGLIGDVSVQPRWATNVDQPILYEIILDVSGSMSWDFNGYGTIGGEDYQCESPDNPNPLDLPYNDTCIGGANSAWKVIEERRIYVAKQAIITLIEQMEQDDLMRVIAFSSGHPVFGDANARAYPADGWSGDQSALEEAVLAAGNWGQGFYNTTGATSSSQAFQLGRQVLDEAPEQTADGQPYEKRVIFITDGVANVFLNGQMNDARDICGDISRNEALNTARCHIGTTEDGTLRPITAMIDQANRMKVENPGVSIYAIALAQFDSAGLNEVVSTPRMLYRASNADVVGPIIDSINIREQVCVPTSGDPVDRVREEYLVDDPAAFGLPDSDTLGYVTLRDDNGDLLSGEQGRLPIRHDPTTGALRFSLPAEQGLAPGTYQLEAFVAYKGPDGADRRYDWLSNATDSTGQERLTFAVPVPTESDQVVELLLTTIDLNPEVDVCAPPATVGLQGDVYVRPQSVQIEDRQPLAYHVVLDVTGSMSWDFDGYGTIGGEDYQCESPDNPNPRNLPYIDECVDGTNSGWRVTEERRIYVVKQALLGLVDDLQESDIMGIVAYASGIGENNARAYPADGMTSNKDILDQAIRDAGQWGQGPYTTRGGNSSVQAMQMTGQLLETAPDKAPDGRTYKDVVIYITDGVANIFLDGETNTARDICANLSVSEALRTVNPCQLGKIADGRLRPVTALINEAFQIKRDDPDLDLYVMAIGPADDTGLIEVASQAQMLYSVNSPEIVDDVFNIIVAQSDTGACRAMEGEFTSNISGHEAGSLPGFPVPENGHGYVTIRDSQGNVLPEGQGRLPVVVDPVNGNLVYRLPVEMGLAPGEYSLEAYINYRGGDGTARTYRWLVNTNNPDGTSLLRFTIPSDAVGDVYTIDPLFLDIDPDVALCPASPME